MSGHFDRSVAALAALALLLAPSVAGCKHGLRKQITVVDGIEIVTNPPAPWHKDPGRVLRIREKLRIRDIGDAFYFKDPERPEIAPDGSIFIMDREELLRFSPEGGFLGDLFRPGQGPGEIESLNRFLIEGDTIYAADGAVNKVVRMTLAGRYLDETRLGDYFETMTRNWIIGSSVNLPKVRGVLSEASYSFFCTSRADGTVRRTYVFPGRFFVKPPVFWPWDRLLWVADPERNILFISLSREYGIKVLDLGAGRVIRSFSRPYPRVPYVIPENMKAAHAGGVPRPDFESDVLELFLPGASLWVRTSRSDAGKGPLFDVFSPEGDFLDSFFVPVKGKILGVRGGTIFVREDAEDGTIAVVLYETPEDERS